jgi:recombination protein RecA
MITVNCIECGKTFDAQRSSAKFCSPNCRVKWNNKPENKDKPEEIEEIQKSEPKTKMVVTPTELKEAPSEESWKVVRDTMDKINKDFGAGSVMILGDKPMKSIESISTGSLGLDNALGIGGLPRGRIVEIFGPESSGKTTLAIHIISEAQKMGLKCFIVDAEHAFDPTYAESLGVKIDELGISQPDYGEQALEIADRMILTGQYAVVIIDSVAALTPKSELEGEMGDSKMGLHPRLMGQACRKMTATVSKTNTLLIFINQVRQTIGNMYGPSEFTPGGNALKFFSSVRIDIRCNALLKDGEDVFGRRSKVKVVKSKVAPPFKNCEFDIIYGEGIDKIGELIEIAANLQVIQKAGSWYSYHESKLGQGKQQVKEMLKDHEPLLNEITLKVKEKINN